MGNNAVSGAEDSGTILTLTTLPFVTRLEVIPLTGEAYR
jgi:hypothetical protein